MEFPPPYAPPKKSEIFFKISSDFVVKPYQNNRLKSPALLVILADCSGSPTGNQTLVIGSAPPCFLCPVFCGARHYIMKIKFNKSPPKTLCQYDLWKKSESRNNPAYTSSIDKALHPAFYNQGLQGNLSPRLYRLW